MKNYIRLLILAIGSDDGWTYAAATIETLHSPRGGTQVDGGELDTVGLVAPVDDAVDGRLKGRDAEGEGHGEEGG